MEVEGETISLAKRADILSKHLLVLKEECGHEATSTEIGQIQAELSVLSDTLQTLSDAMTKNECYRTKFREDLKELAVELKFVFNEISECCEKMQRKDNQHESNIKWFFREPRVFKLQNYLQSLKLTLVTIRIVLEQSQSYDDEKSFELKNSIQEARIVLKSVIAQNRVLTNAFYDPGIHIESEAKVPAVEGIGSESMNGHRSVITSTESSQKLDHALKTSLAQRVSTHVAHLGRHVYFDDDSEHDASVDVKQKWIQQPTASAGKIRYQSNGNSVRDTSISDLPKKKGIWSGGNINQTELPIGKGMKSLTQGLSLAGIEEQEREN